MLTDFYRHFERARPDAPLARWLAAHHPEDASEALRGGSEWAVEADDALRPSEKETRENSRSRSAILHVLRRRPGAARTADVARAAYAKKGWVNPPPPPEPPATTFRYEAAAVSDAETKGSAKGSKREKKDKKRRGPGRKWAEA